MSKESVPELKPKFPEVTPTIEIFPGVHAELMHDFDRYSTGSLALLLTHVDVSVEGKKIGSMCADAVGRWVVEVDQAMYQVPMQGIFQAFYDKHNESVG